MGILIFLTVLVAFFGIFLVGDFLLWYFTGERVPATIEGFEKDMPVLMFETPDGKKHKLRAAAITHIGYRLGTPQIGDVFNAVYRETGEPGSSEYNVRVYGFQNLIAGGVLLMPLLAALGLKYSNMFVMSQLSFLVIMIVIIMGGWIGLKIIRRNY